MHQVLRTRRIPEWLAQWAGSFMNGKSTTLILEDEETESFSVTAGDFQDSPCSPIFFLFYIAEFYDLCDVPALNVSVISFVDDTQLLAFGNIEKSNY